MLKTYRGSCHCGAVQFEADLDLLGCFTNVSDEELSRVPIRYVDGRNDRWDTAPEFPRHL